VKEPSEVLFTKSKDGFEFNLHAAIGRPVHKYFDEGTMEMMVAMTTVKLESALDGCTVAEVEQRYTLSIILHKRENYLRQQPNPDPMSLS
jgi:hypothetical protein